MLQTQGADAATFRLLEDIMRVEELSDFHLCGGTALSLHFGHQLSVDLDLFTNVPLDKSFLEETLSSRFEDFQPVFSRVKSFFFSYIRSIKVDCVYTPAPVLSPFSLLDGIRFWSLPDIIAMKLNAIYGRGSKKDYWDIYELLEHYSLREMVNFFFTKYPSAFEEGLYMSLVYFDDAENQANPVSLKKQSWPVIKKTIEKEVRSAFFSA